MPFGLGLMPGEDDWLQRIIGGGMRTPPIFGGPMGDAPAVPLPTPSAAPPERPGFMGKFDKMTAQMGGAMPLGLALLANSGSGGGFGEIFGKSALQAQAMNADQQQQKLREEYMRAQMEAMQKKPVGNTPSSVAEYEYAKANGYKGSFQEWIAAGGQSSRPSAITVFEYWDKLDPKRKREMLETMRAPTVKDVGGVPSIVLGTGATNPLSSLPQEVQAIAEKERAKSESGQIGEAQGKVAGGIITKGSNAVSTKGTLDIAEPLIDIATGSAAGAARDKVAAFFGEAPTSAQAIAQLKVLQANLMTSMPRMEGPQSDRDVQLYREAAGQIGDPTVPAPIKKAALQTIRQLQNKYIERAGGDSSEAPKRKRYNPTTGKIE
jgi:hypothetical protein